jgi:hypothetical protein
MTPHIRSIQAVWYPPEPSQTPGSALGMVAAIKRPVGRQTRANWAKPGALVACQALDVGTRS